MHITNLNGSVRVCEPLEIRFNFAMSDVCSWGGEIVRRPSICIMVYFMLYTYVHKLSYGRPVYSDVMPFMVHISVRRRDYRNNYRNYLFVGCELNWNLNCIRWQQQDCPIRVLIIFSVGLGKCDLQTKTWKLFYVRWVFIEPKSLTSLGRFADDRGEKQNLC